jgi:hypothetical protein
LIAHRGHGTIVSRSAILCNGELKGRKGIWYS